MKSVSKRAGGAEGMVNSGNDWFGWVFTMSVFGGYLVALAFIIFVVTLVIYLVTDFHFFRWMIKWMDN